MQANLAQVKNALDQMSKDIGRGNFLAPDLKDFKLSVDHLRVTIWAILAFEDELSKEPGNGKATLRAKLTEFRIKRVIQMLTDLRSDVESGAVEAADPDLKALSASLSATSHTISRLTRAAN